MIKAFLIVLLFLLAVLGLAELIHGIKLKILEPENRGCLFYVLLPEKGHALEQIGFCLAKLEWNGEISTTRMIVCLDELGEEEIRKCKKMSRHKDIIFCSSSDLSQFIEFK